MVSGFWPALDANITPGVAAGVLAAAGPLLRSSLAAGLGGRPLVRVRYLLDHGADALGLLQGILDDLLQVNPVSRGLRKLQTVLLDLAHIEQQGGQWTVELTGDLGAGFIHCPRARGRQPDCFQVVVGRRAAFDPLRERRISDSVFLMSHTICLTSLRSPRVNFLLSKNTEFLATARSKAVVAPAQIAPTHSKTAKITPIATNAPVFLRTVELLPGQIGNARSFTGVRVYFLIWRELFLWFHNT